MAFKFLKSPKLGGLGGWEMGQDGSGWNGSVLVWTNITITIENLNEMIYKGVWTLI